MNNEAVIEALRIEVGPTIRRHVDPTVERNACLQSSRIGLEALRYFGIKATPLVTQAISGNAAWAEWQLQGGEGDWPEAAWSVGIDTRHNPEERRYPGHMVLEVDGHLLDLNAGQMARPQHDIFVPETVWTPLLDNGPTKPLAGIGLKEGGVLLYGHVPSPRPYADVKAWRIPERWAGPVIRRMRERLK